MQASPTLPSTPPRQGGFRLHDFATALSLRRCVTDVSPMSPQCVTGCHSEVAGKSYFLVGILNGQVLRQVETTIFTYLSLH